MGATPCGFKSRLRHHFSAQISFVAYFHFVIAESDAGLRADAFLAREIPHLSRSFVADKCEIFADQQPTKPSHKLKSGELIELRVPQLKNMAIEPEPIALDILFEDDSILVINKSAGMVVHPTDHGGHVSGTVVNAALHHLGRNSSADRRPGLVHRLDRDTSGVLIIAKTEQAKLALQKQFADRTTQKEYLAILAGRLPQPAGRIDAPIGRDPHDRTRRMISLAPDARQAITDFETIESFDAATFARVRILTGRTHQIRVHFQSIQCPVAGDPLYGSRKLNEKIQSPRMLLHAHKLKIRHPESGESVEFTAPLPGDFESFLASLRAE